MVVQHSQRECTHLVFYAPLAGGLEDMVVLRPSGQVTRHAGVVGSSAQSFFNRFDTLAKASPQLSLQPLIQRVHGQDPVLRWNEMTRVGRYSLVRTDIHYPVDADFVFDGQATGLVLLQRNRHPQPATGGLRSNVHAPAWIVHCDLFQHGDLIYAINPLRDAAKPLVIEDLRPLIARQALQAEEDLPRLMDKLNVARAVFMLQAKTRAAR